MSRSIARQSIGGGPGIARQPVASKATASAQEPLNYPPGTYTFTAPRGGYWKFAAWGPGFSTVTSADAGDSGSYAEITRFMRVGETAAIVVGAPTANTSITFANGKIVTAGGATGAGGAGPGVATGGDLNINGTAGMVAGNPGGAAPGNGNYRGGAGGVAAPGGAPGGGAGAGTASGGSGAVLAVFLRS